MLRTQIKQATGQVKHLGGGDQFSHMHPSCEKGNRQSTQHTIGLGLDFTPSCSLIIWTGFPTVHILFSFLLCDWGRRIKPSFFIFFFNDTLLSLPCDNFKIFGLKNNGFPIFLFLKHCRLKFERVSQYCSSIQQSKKLHLLIWKLQLLPLFVELVSTNPVTPYFWDYVNPAIEVGYICTF
jgi:hypothetical protein